MEINKVTIKNWRKIDNVTLNFNNNITVINGANEIGKSTVCEAMRFAFVYPGRSEHKDIRLTQPWGKSVGPTIEIAFSHDEVKYNLYRKYLISPKSKLSKKTDGQWETIAEGKTVSDTIKDVLNWPDLDLVYALWPEQNSYNQNNTGTIKETLLKVLNHKTGNDIDVVYNLVKELCDQELTPKRRKPAAGGRWKQAQKTKSEAENDYNLAKDNLEKKKDIEESLDEIDNKLKKVEKETEQARSNYKKKEEQYNKSKDYHESKRQYNTLNNKWELFVSFKEDWEEDWASFQEKEKEIQYYQPIKNSRANKLKKAKSKLQSVDDKIKRANVLWNKYNEKLEAKRKKALEKAKNNINQYKNQIDNLLPQKVAPLIKGVVEADSKIEVTLEIDGEFTVLNGERSDKEVAGEEVKVRINDSTISARVNIISDSKNKKKLINCYKTLKRKINNLKKNKNILKNDQLLDNITNSYEQEYQILKQRCIYINTYLEQKKKEKNSYKRAVSILTSLKNNVEEYLNSLKQEKKSVSQKLDSIRKRISDQIDDEDDEQIVPEKKSKISATLDDLISTFYKKREEKKQEMKKAQPETVVEKTDVKQARESYEKYKNKKQNLEEKKSRKEGELSGHTGSYEDYQHAIEEFERAKNSLKRIKTKVRAFELLRLTIEEQKSKRIKRVIDPVLDVFNNYINEITTHNYNFVNDELNLEKINVANEGEISISSLSQGMREQISALIQISVAKILSKETRTPVVFDDRFVNTDRERRKIIHNIIRNATDNIQFIIFTCEKKRHKSLIDDNKSYYEFSELKNEK